MVLSLPRMADQLLPLSMLLLPTFFVPDDLRVYITVAHTVRVRGWTTELCHYDSTSVGLSVVPPHTYCIQ